MNSKALQKMSPMALHKYMEDQLALFKRMGHVPTMAFTHELALREDGYYHLVKRDKPIEIIDWDLTGQGTRIAFHEKTISERFFRGGPREEDRLVTMGQDICSVEVGELQGDM